MRLVCLCLDDGVSLSPLLLKDNLPLFLLGLRSFPILRRFRLVAVSLQRGLGGGWLGSLFGWGWLEGIGRGWSELGRLGRRGVEEVGIAITVEAEVLKDANATQVLLT